MFQSLHADLLREFSKNRKGAMSLFKVTFFVEFFDQSFYFVLCKYLVKYICCVMLLRTS